MESRITESENKSPRGNTGAKPKRKKSGQGASKSGAGMPRIQASCLFALAVMLLCVSMPHLASGIQRITQSTQVTAWLMAVVFDLAQVVCEVALLLIPILGVKRRIAPACKAVILCCTIMSMVLNVDAFMQHAEGVKGYILATTWGIMLPLGVLTLSYIGSAFVLREYE